MRQPSRGGERRDVRRALARMRKAEFARRRKRLMATMGEGSIAIVPSAPVRQRNRDVDFLYRPDSDFYYLTGFPEPEAVCVLVPGRTGKEFLLFCRERDPEVERWTGASAGLEGARGDYGANEAFAIGDIDDVVPGLMESCSRIYYALGYLPEFDQRVLGWVNRLRSQSRAGVKTPAEFVALDHVIHEMRLYKTKSEVKAMRAAAAISARAHKRAMAACRPGMREYQIEAEILYVFHQAGVRAPAYPPIVAGGKNGCILHYTANDASLRAGELLLIDAGAENEYYAADITRTFPVSGRFTQPQRAIYELVLEAQQAAIAQVRPGKHWNEPHEAAVEVLTEGLARLGLLRGRVKTLVRKAAQISSQRPRASRFAPSHATCSPS